MIDEIGKVQWRAHSIEITSFKFINGGAFATARGEGPFEAYKGPCDIYGVDGFLVASGGEIDVPKVKPRENLNLELDINFGQT